jgi:hypothetical protein
MSYAPSPMQSSGEPEKREIFVTVVDSDGKRIPGAKISVTVDDIPSGSLALGEGPGSFEIDSVFARVSLKAEAGGVAIETQLGSSENAHQFRFPTSFRADYVSTPPEARCPDGTVGNPCVVCNVAGTRVRICV